MIMTAEQIRKWIEAGLICSKIDVHGDGQHFEALIVSDQFENKPTIARHRLVYATLGEKMGAEIHALSLRTFTSTEYNSRC